jgi:hypothetical protein
MMTEKLVSEWPVAQNWGFTIFLVCFFVSMLLFEGRRKLLSSMLIHLFQEKNHRQSIFSESVDNEFISKLFLCLQTAILSAIIIYCAVVHETDFHFESIRQLFNILAISSLLIIAFILYKFLSTMVVGSIFFQKENIQQWNETFFSLVSLNGVALFIPALLMFYLNEAYFLIYIVLVYLFLVELLIIYKIYVIFFQHTSHLLYFILYLCGQEIVPLYLAYKGIVYFYFM